MAEHWSCKPGVGSSILSGGTFFFFIFLFEFYSLTCLFFFLFFFFHSQNSKQPKKIKLHVPTELNPATAPQPDVVMEIVSSTQPSGQPIPPATFPTSQNGSEPSGHHLQTSESFVVTPPDDRELRVMATNVGTAPQEDQTAPTPRYISQAELDAGRLPLAGTNAAALHLDLSASHDSSDVYISHLSPPNVRSPT